MNILTMTHDEADNLAKKNLECVIFYRLSSGQGFAVSCSSSDGLIRCPIGLLDKDKGTTPLFTPP